MQEPSAAVSYNAISSSPAKPAQLALKSVTLPSGFVFPPIFSFHAFFTRQPNPATYASQARQWVSLILAFCSFHRIFRIDLSETALLRESDSETSQLWHNMRIKRHARPEFVQEVIHSMVKAGQAAYDPPIASSRVQSSTPPTLPAGTGALVYWRSPDEWAASIHRWVVDSGQTNSIMTMYELAEPSSTKDFADLPPQLLKISLQILVKQGKAQIFQVADGEGVKFF